MRRQSTTSLVLGSLVLLAVLTARGGKDWSATAFHPTVCAHTLFGPGYNPYIRYGVLAPTQVATLALTDALNEGFLVVLEASQTFDWAVRDYATGALWYSGSDSIVVKFTSPSPYARLCIEMWNRAQIPSEYVIAPYWTNHNPNPCLTPLPCR